MLSKVFLFIVKNFKVIESVGQYKPILNKYKIFFLIVISFKRIEGIVKITINGFQIITLDKILWVNSNRVLLDIFFKLF